MKNRIANYNWQYEKDNSIPNSPQNVKIMKKALNDTGPGFCLAKFRQVTLHLGTGLVHSCHHPTAHKIDKNAVGMDANLLFNTPELKKARKEMLTGSRPAECDFCWRVEDSGDSNSDLISDRHSKSAEKWALPDHDTIVEYTGDEDLYPTYLEVDFSNVCNLKCTYCGPEFSSKWVDELKQNGPIKLFEGTPDEQWAQGWQDIESLNYKNRDENPYVDAFWEWFPEAYKHLKHYRITGGEPLLSKETFKSIQWLIDNPNPDLEVSINSNLSVPAPLWNKFIDLITELSNKKCVSRITIYTSVEGWGKKAEYARTGLDFDLFKSRFEQVVSIGSIRGVVMSAFNIFSITSFQQVLEWILELKRKHNPNKHIDFVEESTGYVLPDVGDSFLQRRENVETNEHSFLVGIDMPYLRHPEFLDVRFCSHQLVQDFWIPTMNFIAQNTLSNAWGQHQGFEQHEYDKFYRTLMHRLYFNRKFDPIMDNDWEVNKTRAKFYQFVNIKDKRDNTNFLEVFPEMEEFYNMCKESNDRFIQ